MRRLIGIRKRLISLNYIQFLGLQIVLGLSISIVQFVILSVSQITTPLTRFEGQSYTFISFLSVLVISAAIETLLFQYLPFVLTSNRKKAASSNKTFKPTQYILCSSVLFGLFHIIGTHWMMPFVVLKVLGATLCGVVLSVSFYILHRKKQRPFLSVSLIHFLINSILVCAGAMMDLLG